MFMRVDVFIISITIISTALLSLLSFSVDETKCAFGSKEETLGPTCFTISSGFFGRKEKCLV